MAYSRSALLVSVSLLAAAVPPAAAEARTTEAAVTISLPKGALAQALRVFAVQSGRDVGFTGALVDGKVSNAVSGRMSAANALQRVLVGTGLTYRVTGTGFVIVREAPQVSASSTSPVQNPSGEAPQPSPGPVAEQDILVVGTRLGGGSATDVKRRTLQSVSVLTAADVEKIPDTSLADTVRRIPGVQISAAGGGGIIAIRGLTQTENRINGRNLASTVGRGYDIGALPSDLVSGIDVYKTPSASQIEGGIGGVIDFHTRRPFDFDGFALGATVKGSYVDLAKNVQPFLSGYVSDRWATGIGEIGLLVGGSYQRQGVAQDIFRTDSNATRTVGSTTFDAPTNAIKRYFVGSKELVTGYASGQWKPSSEFEVTSDFLFNRSNLDFTNTSLTAQLANGTAGRLDTYSGSNAVSGGAFSNVPLESTTSRGTGFFDTYQAGLGGRFQRDALTLSGEVSYTRTNFEYTAPGATLLATAPSLTLDSASSIPRFTVGGIDPTSRTPWRYGNLSEFANQQDSTEWAYRADAIYEIGGFIQNIKAGARFDRRLVDNQFVSASTTALSTPVGNSFFVGLTDNDLFHNDYAQPQWLAVSRSSLRPAYADTVRTFYGARARQPAFDPVQAFNATEKVYNGYGELTYQFPVGGVIVDGNAGLRYVRTELTITGTRNLQGGGSEPVTTQQGYNDWLPSLNLRAALVPQKLFLRLAFSKQITRPPFTQLSPATTIDFVNATGSAGNPALGPLRANQYDAALEWYFAPESNLYVAGFYKDVSGFVRNQVTSETINGRSILVSRPQNVDSGWIKGFEAGYQQRFSFLPGVLAGLGAQASYTFVDSIADRNAMGYRVPFEQLSKHNYTVAATYDLAGLTASASWVWRSRLVEATTGDRLGRPLYRNPYGQLDASIAYALNPGVSLTASAVNALQRRTTEYFADRRFINQTYIEDRRFFAGILVKLGAAK